jgi:hypothetical protein
MADEVNFFPLNPSEVDKFQNQRHNPQPAHKDFECGTCGEHTNGRVLASVKRAIDGATVWHCVCSCSQREGTILVERGGNVIAQLPEAKEFHPGEKWPSELEQLFDEAAKAYAAGAYTVTAMVSRKILMACACNEGDTDGKSFVDYVTYITTHVLTDPKAKDLIDKIRGIGNEANHKIKFVSPPVTPDRELHAEHHLLAAVGVAP